MLCCRTLPACLEKSSVPADEGLVEAHVPHLAAPVPGLCFHLSRGNNNRFMFAKWCLVKP